MMRIMYLLMGFSLKISLVFADFNEQERSFKEESAVTAVVFSDPKELVFDLIEVVSKAESFRQRGELLKRLENYFDIAAMSRFVLGRAVTQIDSSQLTEFISLFGEYQLLIVIPKFEGFSAQDLEFIGMRSLAEGDKFVLSFNYTQPNGGVVGLGFYVKKKAEGIFKIYDMQIEGLKMLMTWRREYQPLFRRNGFDGVMNILRDNLEQLKEEFEFGL